MKNKIKFIAGIFTASLILTGCGIKSAEYSPSVENMQQLQKIQNVKIGLKDFTAKKPGEHSILCRLAETVTTPNNEPYETYIQNAFKDELILAGIYDKNADLKLSGYVEEVVGSSMLGDAYWSFKIKVSSSNGKAIEVNTKKEYSSAFLAITACNNMGSTFSGSVKTLIHDIITHPKFNSLLTK